MIGYKVLTHNLRPPVRGGEPIWDGTVPHELPHVHVDSGNNECGEGWNFCRSPATALRIAGLWPNGRPSRLFQIEARDADVVERGDKCRAATLDILEEITDLRPAIEELSAPFGDLAGEMVAEQIAWREALGRPGNDPEAVEEGLRAALSARNLSWTTKRYQDTWSARNMNPWAANAAWDAWEARNPWAANAAWDAWDTRNPWTANAAWDAWEASISWNPWASWAARDALVTYYASRREWISVGANTMTVGIREAYRNGLYLAILAGPGVLGWIMKRGEK